MNGKKFKYHNYRDKLSKIIGFCVFAILLVSIFCKVTYLFRNVGYNRRHIVGIKQENDLDMVYIGGSAAFMYWQPLKAWNDCGFTSYNYATDTIQAESIKAYVEEVRTCQNPDLFVIGVRAFQYYSDDPEEAGLRNSTDVMDITSVARYHLLNDYSHNRVLADDTDVASYYFDIAKYHTNTDNLGLSAAWSLSNNEGVSLEKGWEWKNEYAYLEEPVDFHTEEREELPANALKILRELLTYCRDEELNVLFVVCPYYISAEDQAKYNTIGDTIESYGFAYLNANEYYDEMGIDFTTDFYNRNHVNLFGAEKYTEFLENYIVQNYCLEDHRGDSSYDSWNEAYHNFCRKEEENAIIVDGLKKDVEQTIEIVAQMKKAKSLAEWNELAEDARYTLVIVSSGDLSWTQDSADEKVLTDWGLDKDCLASQIRVITDNKIEYTNEEDGVCYAEGVLGIWKDIPYQLSVENNECSIVIDGEIMGTEGNAINVIVFDNNYRKVVGNVTLVCGDNKKMEIRYK